MLDADDRFHGVAAETWRQLVGGEDQLLTHSYVLVETVALAQRRLGVEAVATLRDDVVPALRVVCM